MTPLQQWASSVYLASPDDVASMGDQWIMREARAQGKAVPQNLAVYAPDDMRLVSELGYGGDRAEGGMGGYGGDPEYEAYINANAVRGPDGRMYLPTSGVSQLSSMADARSASEISPLAAFAFPLTLGIGGALAANGGFGGLFGGDGLTSLIGDAGVDTLAGNSLAEFQQSLINAGVMGDSGGLAQLFSGLDAAGQAGLTGIGAQAAQAIQAGGGALKSLADSLGMDEGTLRMLGGLAQTGLGIFAGSQQADKTNALGEKILGMGAPSLARYEASFAPGFDLWQQPAYKSALQASWDTGLRAAGAKYGNPLDNPGAMAEVNKNVLGGLVLPGLQNYREMNRAAGFANVPQYAQIQTNAIGQQGGAWEAAGAGLERLLNPRQNYTLNLG